MINRAMTYLADELMLAIGLNEGDITIDSFLSMREKKARGIVVSLLNVEEELTPKTSKNEILPGTPNSFPPKELFLNLNITIVFDFEDYGKGLEHLASVAGYLHNKPVFSKDNGLPENPFPEGLSSFSLALRNLDIDDLYRVWCICGGMHYPALFYKLRLLDLIQAEKPEVPELNTNKIVRQPLSINKNSSTNINLK